MTAEFERVPARIKTPQKLQSCSKLFYVTGLGEIDYAPANRSDQNKSLMAARFEASQQLRYLPNGIFHDTACEDSQCDTIYDDDDEEITEEEESLETDYKNEDDDADDATDDLSTSDADDSETNGDLSFEIQDFINQIPEITEHFQIISKIGEGIRATAFAHMCRNVQFCIQGHGSQVSPVLQRLGCGLGSTSKVHLASNQKAKGQRQSVSSQVRRSQEDLCHQQPDSHLKRAGVIT